MRKLTTIIILLSVFIMAPSIANAITVSISNVAQNENNGNMTFTVTITEDTVSGNAKFDYATVDDTATTGDNDYTTATGTVMFNNGDPVGEIRTFDVPITGDTKVEADETFTVTLTSQGGGDIVTGSPATGTIQNDDAATLAIDDVTHNEGNVGGTTYTFTVTLTGAVDQAFTVDYATADDSATTADNDYTAVAATALNFVGTNGETQTFNITVNGDTKVEANERFFVNLSNVQAGGKNVTISDAQGDGNITNDDAATLAIDNVMHNEGNVGGTTYTFTVTLTGAVDQAFTVDYATADDSATAADNDYTAVAATALNFAGTNGETQTLNITVNGDTKFEANERFFVNLSNVQAGGKNVTISDAQGDGTITNDDAATLAIDDVTHDEGNAGGTTYTFTVTLTGDVDQAFTVDYATADDSATAADNDYTAVAATALNFAGTNGETQTLNITVNGDTKFEANERFFVNLSNVLAGGKNVTISDAQGDGNITNDDRYDITINDITVNENAGTAQFTVTVTPAIQAGHTIIVDYATADGSAGQPGDYTATSGTTTFNPGDTTKQISVPVINDTIVELAENFFVNLSNSTPADITNIFDTQGECEINPDNNDKYGITIDDITVNENVGTAQFTVTLSQQVLTGQTVTVDYATSDGTATGGSDYTAIGSTTLTFNPGDTTQPVNVTIADDSDIEAAEDFFVDLSNASANASINDNQGRCEISIDDKYDITINNISVDEDVGNAQFTVTVTPAIQAGHTVIVNYATADGSAGQPGDYTSTSGTTTFSPGDTTQPVTVPIVNDTEDESTENFFVNLSNSTPADRTTISDTQGYCDIIDNDYTVVFTAAANGSLSGTTIQMVNHGDDCTPVNAVPDPGYYFAGWSGGYGTDNPLIITNVTSDMSIQAYFYSNKNCVWVDQHVNGGQFNYLGTFNLSAGSGTIVTLTNQNDGRTTCADAVWFHKTDGSDDVIIDNYDPGYTEYGTWINSSSPNFYPPVTGLARYSNDVTTPGSVTYNPTLAGGTYEVYAWWNSYSGRTRNVPYCILNFTDHIIRASTGVNGAMTVTINVPPPIDISGSTVFTVNSGSNLTFDILPDAGYVIEYLKVDGQYINQYDGWSGATTYSLSYVTSDHNVDVRFDFGETTESCFEVDQTKNAGKWNYLATLELPSGQVAYVTLTRESGDGTSTCADAVRFVKTSDGTEIIVDNEGTFDGDGYFTPTGPNFITTGTWRRSAGNKWYGPNPPKSIYSSTNGDTATWIPDLPSSAQYDIYAWWTKSGKRAQHAPYCVYNHAGKTIKATAGPHGYLVLSGVTVGPDESYTFTVDAGTDHTFNISTISGETGYKIQEVVVDGQSAEDDCVPTVTPGVTTNSTYTFSNVNESHRIRVSFEDHGDDCDTATPLNCNSSANGYISAGDKDYFRMDIGSGILRIWTTDQAGDLDPGTDTFGYLLGEDCDLFNPIETDDNSGTGFNFQIEKEVAAGTYYIVVGHSDAMSGEGSYALHVECTHIIRATAYSGGEIDPEGDIIVEHGGTTTFTITPDGVNTIEDVLVDSLSIGGVSTYTFFNVTANHTILAQFSLPPSTCNDISDQTMNTMMVGVPANIMFMLDDSGSMDWEFMTDEGNGLFGGNYYPFDNPGDNVYPGLGHILRGEERGLWMSQWSGYNAMFYNPKTTYKPWPDWHPTLENADLDEPRSHPRHATPTFDLNASYYSIPDNAYPLDNEGSFSGSLFVPSGPTFTVTGTWRRSGGSPWYGPDPPRSIYTRTLGATGTWTTTLPTGDYNVYAWWTTYSSRATQAPYTINHDGGSDTIRVDQRYNGGEWNLLIDASGTSIYHFDTGTPASVSIVRENDNDNTCADAVCFIPVDVTDIDIPNAHYYTWADTDGNGAQDSGETVYLVNLTKSGTTYATEYYVVDVSDDLVWAGDLTSVSEASVPDSVKPRKKDGTLRSPTEERQNFANWYSFYRKREQTAMAAVARVIDQVDGVQIGIKSIHNRLHQPVLKINVDGVDERDTLLSVLYDGYRSSGGTPLRRGLQSVGQYYDQEDGTVNGGIGDSPYEANGEGGECQQCFAIVMTDGFWNGGAPDVDNEDGDEDTLFDGPPYGDTYSNTLADVAMYYYENDLASLLDDEIPDNPHDNAEHQHMVTYGISFGVTGTLNPDDYDIGSGATVPWPHVIPNQRTTLDDLWHASVNGRGMFLSAKNPEELINSLLDIMENIAARTGSASSVSINGDELYDMVGADIRMFQASYSSGTMTGDVRSFAIDELTGGVTETPLWSAVDELENDLNAYGHTGRIIATYSDVSYTGIPFRHTNISTSGSTEQQNYLLPDWGDPVVATPENLINYLRGNETHEVKNGGPFRSRSKPLGDIVHSSPVHKDGVLYVGGNDGMLHAINAENGHELFAYVPNLVYENLKEFGNPDYQHKFFVDLTPSVKSGVMVSSVQKTLLIGGLGKGGKGYYCLDISGVSNNPCVISSENILANRVMWEYPNAGTTAGERDDLGYTYSKAFVVKSNDPTNAQWIVIFGNGYNSENSNAVLLILNPSDGSLLKRIDTQVGSCNGLSLPLLVDYDSDEKVDFVYAGDLKGNLWKFDLTSNNYNNWDVAYYSGTSPQPLFQAKGPGGETQHITTKPDAMFHCERDGIMVVFATGMYLGGDDLLDTSTQTVYGIWDYQYEDIDDTEYLGSFDRESAPLLSNQPLYDVSMLEQISIFEGYVDVGGVTSYVRVLSNNDPDWQTTTVDPGDSSCGENTGSTLCDPNSTGSDPDPVNDAGWYFDFPTTGERVVSDLLIRLGNVVLISFTPSDSPCSVGGDSMVMEMDACTGGRLPYAQFDLNDDGVIDENDLIRIEDPDNPGEYIWVAPTGRRYEGRLQPPVILRLPRTETEKKYFSSSGGVIEELTEKAARIGMIYWREHD